MKRLRLKIYDLVQGVSFRALARQQAQKLGLSAWVKNMPDGSVETVTVGEEEKLNEYKMWCKKGPLQPGLKIFSSNGKRLQVNIKGLVLDY